MALIVNLAVARLNARPVNSGVNPQRVYTFTILILHATVKLDFAQTNKDCCGAQLERT